MNRKERRAAAKRSRSAGKKISLNDAVALAIQLHQQGRLEDAERIYTQVIEAKPDQPDALHYLGVLLHQRGEGEEAVALIQRAVSAHPYYPYAHNNLGNVLKELGRLDQAEAAYRACLAIDPAQADALSNLGSVLRDKQQYDEALSCLEQAVELAPEHAQAYQNLGNVLKRLDRINDAIAAYRRSISLLRPKDSKALISSTFQSLTRTLYVQRNYDEVKKVLTQWMEFDPGSATARHMLSACTGEDVPERASDGFVAETFDGFAGSFDEVLKRLEYRAPELLLTALQSQIDTPLKQLRILDAGCGTGLCGPLLRDYAKRLIGVDLSRGMIDKARGRGVYDELLVAELTDFMGRHPGSYDLIASADTLCYFGDLTEVLDNASGALAAGGLLIFTLERMADPEAGETYRLNPHGRYSHTEEYLRLVIQQAGLGIIALTNDCLRYEAGEPVMGMVITAVQQPSMD